MTNFGTVVSGGEELGDGGEVARELLAHRLARVVVGRPQDRRRMRGRRDEVREVGLDRAPAHVAELELRAEERLARRGPQQDERTRVDDVELGAQPRHAGLDLRAVGRLVDAPLAALVELEVLDDVGDVDVAAVDPDLLERPVELAPGRADEGVPLAVLAIPRHLADQRQSRLLAALAEDRLRRGSIEMADAAALGRLAQRRQVARAGEEGRGVEPVLDSRHVLLAARGRGGRTGRTRGWTPASSVSLRRLEWT